jgi:hypothetical protein
MWTCGFVTKTFCFSFAETQNAEKKVTKHPTPVEKNKEKQKITIDNVIESVVRWKGGAVSFFYYYFFVCVCFLLICIAHSMCMCLLPFADSSWAEGWFQCSRGIGSEAERAARNGAVQYLRGCGTWEIDDRKLKHDIAIRTIMIRWIGLMECLNSKFDLQMPVFRPVNEKKRVSCMPRVWWHECATFSKPLQVTRNWYKFRESKNL